MSRKPLRKALSIALALTMLAPMTMLSQTAGFMSVTASAAAGGPQVVDSGTVEGGFYTLDSEGTLTVTGQEVTLGSGLFAGKGIRNVEIRSTSIKVHPYAFTDNEELATICFSSKDPVTIEGVIEGLTENTLVTIPLYSKKYTPAGKKFNYTEYSSENSAKRNDFQTRYDTAAYLWEDTSEILAEAEADEVITVSDVAEKTEEFTKSNWNTTFPNAKVQHFGTMAGFGTMADPYRIENTDNWRYLAYMTEKSLLSGSYYGQDRGTYVKLTADLTLSDKDGTFVPLGGRFTYGSSYTDSAYKGNFDGNGHTITLDVTNLDNYDGMNSFGLFAKTDCPYIKNLHISGQVISNEANTGLFIGHGSWDYLYNCSSDATLILQGSGEFKSGAFVGYSYRPTLENCHFTGSIIGDDPSIPAGEDDGTTITAVGGFVGEFSGSDGGESMKNCYFAPSEIKVGSTGSAMLYRPYYGSYSGWCGMKETENNYHNREAEKLNGADMGDLDQGMSDSDGIDSLNETEFWDNGALTLPRATVQANPGTTTFVYTGGQHRLINDIQAVRSYSTGQNIKEWDNFPYMPGYGYNGNVHYKVNDGEWSATPPTATEVGDYTVYYRATGDNYHRDSEIKTLEVKIVPWQELPGSGTPADPYTISNDLEWSIFCDMRDTADKYFKLVDDIVVSETRESLRGPGHPLEFNGVFDGDGHKITLYWVNNSAYGYGTSLFGRIIGHSDYYDSEQGGWHYFNPTVKNLILDGIMINQDYTAPLAQSIDHATVSNIISNMTLVQTGYGGDRDGAGIVHTGALGSVNGGSHYYNIKVGGIFDNNSESSDRKWAGITSMNDFWKSGTDFIVKDCYVAPECKNIKVSGDNCVILGNHVEGKSTIDNCFYGGNILDIIPVDEETGETTNTQGTSDADGLAALDATGYWANGEPTMPRATLTQADRYRTIDYIEPPAPEIDPETGEEIPAEPTVYSLIDAVPCEGSEVWYQVNGGEWSTTVPTATEPGRYEINYKAVGDYLHRDSEICTTTTALIYEWATPAGLSVDLTVLPYESYGSFTSGDNAVIMVTWDDHEGIDQCAFTVEIVTPDGKRGNYFDSAPVGREYWHEQGTEKPGARFFVGLLGDNEQQTFIDGVANGAKYGDTIIVTATSFVNINGASLESNPCKGVDLTLAAGSKGKSFPVLEEGMSNDSWMQAEPVVLGDRVFFECLASGGTPPYKYEVKYKKGHAESFSTKQSYKSNSLVYFTPASASDYVIMINAKDAEGTVVSKEFSFNVKKALNNLSEISATILFLGETAVISADSEGGIEPREYKVSYKAAGSDTPVVLQNYSTNSTVTFTPENTGSYTVTVSTKDARDVAVNKTFEVAVYKVLENTSTLSGSRVALGRSISVKCASDGGIGDKQYKVSVKAADSNSWTTVQEYSSETSVKFTPDNTGTYTVRVIVRDTTGKEETKDLTLEAYPQLINTSSISPEEMQSGKSVTVTCASQGGYGTVTYAVSYYNPSTDKWYQKSDYSSADTVKITLKSTVNYTIRVKCRDEAGNIVKKDMVIRVYEPLKNTSSLSASLAQAETPVTVTFSSEGGLGVKQFAVWLQNKRTTKWTQKTEYAPDSTFALTVGEAGEYIVRINCMDEAGVVSKKDIPLSVYPVLQNTSAVTPAVLEAGKSVTVECSSAGGFGAKQYAVSYYNKSSEKWYQKTDYSDETTVVLTLKNAVDYTIRISCRDEEGNIVNKDVDVSVYKPLSNTSKVRSNVIEAGKDVTVECSSTGGFGAKQYAVWYYNKSSEKWYQKTDYSAETTVAVTLKNAVDYTIRVNCKDEEGNIAKKDIDVSVYKPLENTSAVTPAVLEAGKDVTVECSSTGGFGAKQYAVWYYNKSSGKWYQKTDYSDETTVAVTLKNAVDYTIRVNCKDEAGNIVKKDFDVSVYKPLENTSAVTPDNIEPGQDVTVNCSSTGGFGTKQYAVWYYNQSSKKWYQKTDYSDETTVAVTLKYAVDYTIRVNCKDEAGNIVKKDFDVSVYKPLVNNSTVTPTVLEAGKDVTVECSSTGGVGAKQFAVWYYNKSSEKWYQKTDYGDETTVAVTLKNAVDYTIRVNCKDEAGNIVKKDFDVSVYKPLANTSSVSPTVVQAGSSVTVKCSSTGGFGAKQFAVWYYNKSSKKWYQKTDYGSETTVALTLKNAADYTIRVNCRDEMGTVVKKDISVRSYAALKNTSSLNASSIPIGYALTLNASSTGGYGKVKYAAQFKKDTSSTWTKLQDYSDNQQIFVKPTKRGTHTVRVSAKDEAGHVVTLDLTFKALSSPTNS